MARCPACHVPIKAHEIACRRHWFSLPAELRNRIWRLYRSAPGGEEHRAVVFEAVRMLVPKETPPEQAKVHCIQCGFLIDHAGPCEEHSPFKGGSRG
jgi:hypothetical protein